jgi:hypothetical protein
MIRHANVIVLAVALALPAAAAGQSLGGTAVQHEEWFRKLTANGSTTGETMISDQDLAGDPARSDSCRKQSVFEASAARHWEVEPCG